MPFQVKCECGKTLNIPDRLAGKKVKCPCGNIFAAVEPPIELSLVEPPKSSDVEPSKVAKSGIGQTIGGIFVAIVVVFGLYVKYSEKTKKNSQPSRYERPYTPPLIPVKVTSLVQSQSQLTLSKAYKNDDDELNNYVIGQLISYQDYQHVAKELRKPLSREEYAKLVRDAIKCRIETEGVNGVDSVFEAMRLLTTYLAVVNVYKRNDNNRNAIVYFWASEKILRNVVAMYTILASKAEEGKIKQHCVGVSSAGLKIYDEQISPALKNMKDVPDIYMPLKKHYEMYSKDHDVMILNSARVINSIK